MMRQFKAAQATQTLRTSCSRYGGAGSDGWTAQYRSGQAIVRAFHLNGKRLLQMHSHLRPYRGGERKQV